jgi:hypothetical protein
MHWKVHWPDALDWTLANASLRCCAKLRHTRWRWHLASAANIRLKSNPRRFFGRRLNVKISPGCVR